MKKWLNQRNLLFSGAGRPTHQGFDGWKARIDNPMDHEDFLHQYACMLYEGKPLYVIEQKSERFPFFVDIDYKQEGPFPLDAFVAALQSLLNERESAHVIIVCKRPDRTESKGYHLHVPSVIVDAPMALGIRTRLLAKLPTDQEPWHQIIDSSVYRHAGLRMVGSRKRKGTTVYLAHRVYGDHTLLAKLHKNVGLLLRLTSIRTTAPLTQLKNDIQPESGPEPRSSEARVMHDDATLLALDEWFVRCWVGTSPVHITKVTAVNACYWINTTSNYCLNKGGDHRSSTVWFLATQQGIRQHCFSPHVYSGKSCDGYESKLFLHSVESYKALYSI